MFKKKGKDMENQAFTETYLLDKVSSADTTIEMLQDRINRLQGSVNDYNFMVSRIHEWALEQLNNGVDEQLLQELADIVGFELKKEYQVCVQVEYVFTVKAVEEEVQSIIDNLDIPRLYDDAIEDSYVWGEVIDSSYDEV